MVVVLTLLAMAWGASVGVEGTLTLAAFAVGAIAGAALAPLALEGGQQNEFALAVALPAALVVGGLAAAVVERWAGKGRRARAHRARVRRRRRRSDAIAGALLAAVVALTAAWLLGASVLQIGPLRGPVQDSAIVDGLNTALTRPGPSQEPYRRPLDPFPIVAIEGPPIDAVNARMEKDADVLRADHSVVRITVVTKCGTGGGSGWMAGKGVVATNAHVAEAADILGVQVRGRGRSHPARAIWFDPVNDVALLRVPSLDWVPPLPIARTAPPGTPAAALGFPGFRHDNRAARIGPTTTRLQGFMGGRLGEEFPRALAGRLVTTFRGRGEPGSSGGPIVDSNGHVLAMVFGGSGRGRAGLAVPTRFVLSALKRARSPVDTGACPSRGR